MISVVLPTLNDARRLGETLGALVPAAVDGLVRQVVVADAGSTDATLVIADDAGATMVAGGLQAGMALAKEDWVLVLDCGARLAPGWDAVIRSHAISANNSAVIRLGPRKGLLSLLAPAPVVGLLVRRGDVPAGMTLAELARAAKSPVTLKIPARLAD